MKEEFSAGGVVFTKKDGKLYILICQHSQHHGWVFPKGLIGDKITGEGKEETAIREVEEETGALGKILEPLSPITFWYTFQGEKRKKTVYYYIMEYIFGDITKHDREMVNVEWITPQEVEKKLTYAADRTVWREAQKIIDNVS